MKKPGSLDSNAAPRSADACRATRLPAPKALVELLEGERAIRSRPVCLYIDRDEDPKSLRLQIVRDGLSSRTTIVSGLCLGGERCLPHVLGRGLCELLPADFVQVDLVLFRIDLSEFESSSIACLLDQLRGRTRSGGMLYIYSSNGQGPDAGAAAALDRHSPARDAGRRLFNTLFANGWAVIKTIDDIDRVGAVACRP